MSLSVNIKNKIKDILDGVVTSGELKTVMVDDLKTSPIIDRDIPSFPAAILTSPSSEGGYLTNRENMRTYRFTVTVIQKGENLESADDIETLSDFLLDIFDDNPTLSGVANGGLEPSSSTPEAIISQGKSYIIFTITLKAHASKLLNF